MQIRTYISIALLLCLLFLAGCATDSLETIDRESKPKPSDIKESDPSIDLDQKQPGLDSPKQADFGIRIEDARSGADMTAMISKYRNLDNLGAFREAKKLASINAPAGQMALAEFYYDGIGVVQDRQKAISWFTKSAKQGFPPAQFKLAQIYEWGKDVEIDMTKSMDWLMKAVDQHYPPAQSWLGSNYFNGTGVLRDRKLAKEWYEKAAIQNDANGQFNLGAMYIQGSGVPMDRIKAFAWLKLSAENGYEDAKRLIKARKRLLTEEDEIKIDNLYLSYKQKIKPYTKYDLSNFIDTSKLADSKAELELKGNLLKQRILFNGFSIIPPKADNWSGYGVPRISSAVGFHNDIRSKIFKKQLATNIIRVSLFDLENVAMSTEDFIEHLKTTGMFKEGPRQKNMDLSLSEEKFKGANCVRFELTAEDDNVPGMGSKIFLISALGMECIHPVSPGVHISIVYTQRAIKDKNVKSYKSIANDFIQNFEFSEYK